MSDPSRAMIVFYLDEAGDHLLACPLRLPQDALDDPNTDSRDLSNLATAWWASAAISGGPDDLRAADEASEAALARAEQFDDASIRAAVHQNRAAILVTMGHHAEAKQHSTISVELYRKLAASDSFHRAALADALTVYFATHLDQPFGGESLQPAKELVDLRRAIVRTQAADDDKLAAALLTLASVLSANHLHQPALKAAREAVEIRKQINAESYAPESLALALSNLACRYADIEDYDNAIAQWSAAANLYGRLGEPYSEVRQVCLSNMELVTELTRPTLRPPSINTSADPMWATYGRVDADGTVWVKTADGERAVGSWQAGPPEEGLAHFVRRYEDLLTEVALLETRLASGAADASQILTTAKRLRGGLDEAHVVGDIDGLGVRLDAIIAVAQEKAAKAHLTREVARAEAIARKTTLVEEAEKLAAESTSWKATGDRFKEILEDWKTIRGVDKKTDGELWKRFSIARDSFTRRRGGHFASLDSQRKQAQEVKDELVAEAEALAESTDWTTTANRLRNLMYAWKAAPRASKEAEQKLWERFRTAQDTFFTRRQQVFSEGDTKQKQALAKRLELLARAEALNVDADPKAAQAAMRDILNQWHDTGRAPRNLAAILDRRLRAVEDRIREGMDAAWRRAEPSANPLLTQMRDQVAEAEARLERARAAGDSKRIKEAEQALHTRKKFLELAEYAS